MSEKPYHPWARMPQPLYRRLPTASIVTEQVCATCGGTGEVPYLIEGQNAVNRLAPCPSCALTDNEAT